jgi:hypothetical protein
MCRQGDRRVRCAGQQDDAARRDGRAHGGGARLARARAYPRVHASTRPRLATPRHATPRHATPRALASCRAAPLEPTPRLARPCPLRYVPLSAMRRASARYRGRRRGRARRTCAAATLTFWRPSPPSTVASPWRCAIPRAPAPAARAARRVEECMCMCTCVCMCVCMRSACACA